MSKYINYTNFLKDYFEIVTSYEEFTKDKKITFICKDRGHTNVLSITSFGNKKAKIDISDFCQGCKEDRENEEKSEKYKKEILERLGHRIIKVNFTTRKVIYICGNCGEENETFTQNLNKESNTGVCGKCQNDKNRKDYKELKKEIEDHGYTLLTKKDDYKTNKQKLDVLCKCGNPHSSILSDLKRDKCCQKCKLKKYEETCMEKYGVKNVSQNPEIFEKICKTMLTKKSYKLPCGKEIMLMGWENKAVDMLLFEEKVDEKDLYFGKDIPTFPYVDDDNKQHVYHPDIFIKSKKIIVEVKSIYTYILEKRKNIIKFATVIKSDYTLRLILYDDRKDLNKDITFDKENKDNIEEIIGL